MITNDFVYYFEKGLRANKIGIPACLFIIIDEKNSFEDVSKDLAKEALLRKSIPLNHPMVLTESDYIYNADVNKENLSPFID